MKRLAFIAVFTMLLFCLLPTAVMAAELLVPVGKVVGLQLKDDHVTVAGFDDRLGKAARDCGLKVGDDILSVNGVPVSSMGQIRQVLQEPCDCIRLSVRRGSRQMSMTMEPVRSEGCTRLGIFLRQGISGVGTVTWYDPASGTFGALGHGVNDNGTLLRLSQGNAFPARVESIEKGRHGAPGQLRGMADNSAPCAELFRNTPQGVFGKGTSWPGEPVPAANADQLHTGPAAILSTVTGDTPVQYDIEIVRLFPTARKDGRNLLLRVTDPKLLEATGGIVQGMSGSPILQDGRLVGAVTHVLVNDPTMGYGIFIGNMLDAAA